MGYADVNPNVLHETRVNNVTGIASTQMARILFYQKARLRAAASLVITAGTNASAGVDIYVGTTSVGAITTGTDTAGVVRYSGTINAEVPAGSYVEIRGKANSATMVNSYALVYDVRHDDTTTF